MTSHGFICNSAANTIKDLHNISLVVTSPPYPMIQMWDEIFGVNPETDSDAFEKMHEQLDDVWSQIYSVVIDGGFVCINIGDATRTINDHFRMYNNHARISSAMIAIGFTQLPGIIWRKQSNAPNKFMGSGTLPAGAYVTMEHEHILIFRKGNRRKFTDLEKMNRRQSSIFWEERNVWFSDTWDFKGVSQSLNLDGTRKKSAAYPFELPYRLINMFSVYGDTVLDPFSGTGTTAIAAAIAGRNSINVDVDATLNEEAMQSFECNVSRYKNRHLSRIKLHDEFVKSRDRQPGHVNKKYGFRVMTLPESEIVFFTPEKIERHSDRVIVSYDDCEIA